MTLLKSVLLNFGDSQMPEEAALDLFLRQKNHIPLSEIFLVKVGVDAPEDPGDASRAGR